MCHETKEVILESSVEDLDDPLPEVVEAAKSPGNQPPGFRQAQVRVGVRRWPDGAEVQFRAALTDTLGEILTRGGEVLGESILPPHPQRPLDELRCRQRHPARWSEPLTNLDELLWVLLAQNYSRHFAIDFKLVVQINSKWGIGSAADLTPRQLLIAFGFDPTQFSLYYANSADLLPPDTPLMLHRGDRFEAQKDGRYGYMPAPPRGLQTLEQDVEQLCRIGVDCRILACNGQRYVDVRGLEIPAPPWSASTADILVAAPATYPNGGLDAFYIQLPFCHNCGSMPNQQSVAPIDGRNWGLISWHYANGREWDPSRDDLSSHIAHCRGFFLKRGVR